MGSVNPYAPDLATQRAIIEQELRNCHNTIALLGFRRRVEMRLRETIGDSGAEALKAIDADLRTLAARVTVYEELLAELDAIGEADDEHK